MITFRHESGRTVAGEITGPGIGPTGEQYMTVRITPDELIKHGLDRETRHRTEGMTRQVRKTWINEGS